MNSSVPFRTLVLITLGAVGSMLAIAFVVFQARYLILGPQIRLTEEPLGPQNERQVFLGGTARNISRLWINDRQIYTDPNGSFKEAVILESGYTVVTLRAEDRFGRIATIEKPLVYAPATFIQ